ncbi:MAG: alpha/beta fold hydrolase, partial [Acidimicrobiales bacterium]|nr:alpha/beta fold hydrolase [Acidimicrobiales bacterium]
MDQRNAGGSSAPVSAGDGWRSFTEDHLALADELRIDQTHLMGGCIGSSYCLSMCQIAPERVSAAVLQNPIGLTDANRQLFMDMFDGWPGLCAPPAPSSTLTHSTVSVPICSAASSSSASTATSCGAARSRFSSWPATTSSTRPRWPKRSSPSLPRPS